jgi:DNA polymerase-1
LHTGPRPTTIDFETLPIQRRPEYPPKPVGVAIKYWGEAAKYWSWGHPEGNNCTFEEAAEALRSAYQTNDGLLFQNAKFDIDVAEVHFGLSLPNWQRLHDTMLLLFLDDPHAESLGLKQSAQRLLGMPPGERDAVADWLIEHQPIEGRRITPQGAGEFIAFAPGDIVGPYAIGDVVRTERIFELLYEKTLRRGMGRAYDRERELLLCLLDMERTGCRVDLPRLRADVANYSEVLVKITTWVHHRLGDWLEAVNLDSNEQLVKELIELKLFDASKVGRTQTGQIKSDKAALKAGILDPQLSAVLNYRASLQTCLQTFMRPWLATAEKSGGYIFTEWHQTRNDSGYGARTGRLSSSPNFQNIPKAFKPVFNDPRIARLSEDDRYKISTLPDAPILLPPLPLCRQYIVPYNDGDLLLDRDYSQQELRILGHFEYDDIMRMYLEDPWVDLHEVTRTKIHDLIGRLFERVQCKAVNFGCIYGEGPKSLSERYDEPFDVMKDLKKATMKLYPNLQGMYDDMRERRRNRVPIRTWGGREYYCEPDKVVTYYENGFAFTKTLQFDYKMVNVLIQGSAADSTKEAIVRYYRAKPKHHRLLIQVHDSLVPSVPRSEAAEGMAILKTAMEMEGFAVPMLSEGDWSDTNWSDLREYDKKGRILTNLAPIEDDTIREGDQRPRAMVS